MKFLLDEHVEGYDKKLLELGHTVEYVKKLRDQDEKFRNDFNIVMHAKENGLILITKDKEPGQACKDNKIPCIWLSDKRIFEEMVIPNLDELQKQFK